MTLFRTYHIPYNAYAGDDGFYAVNYDDLIGSVRDEANEYLDKKVAEMKKLGVEKVTRGQQRRICRRRDYRVGEKDPGRFDRYVFAWALGSEALCTRQCDRERGAPYEQSSADCAGQLISAPKRGGNGDV